MNALNNKAKRETKAQKNARLEAEALAAQALELEAQANAEVLSNEENAALEVEANAALESTEVDEENEETKAAKLRERAESAQALLLDSIRVRIAHAPNDNFKKNMTAELNQLSGRNALIAIEKCVSLEVDFAALATAYAITDKNAYDYVAIYAAQKIRKSIFALACGMTSVFDGYTNAIMNNLVKLQSLSNRGSQRALSNKVVFDEDMQTEAVRSFKVCEPSTASTQASSTRQAMRFLNICNVIKSRKDDAMTLTDSLAAQKLQSMYSA